MTPLLCVQEKLNVGAIDAVSAALRAALEEEREALTEDVEYLQALLQDEAERQVRKCIRCLEFHTTQGLYVVTLGTTSTQTYQTVLF